LLDRRILGEYLQLLALDDIPYLSVGHGPFSRDALPKLSFLWPELKRSFLGELCAVDLEPDQSEVRFNAFLC
jgi:hypothetical protein